MGFGVGFYGVFGVGFWSILCSFVVLCRYMGCLCVALWVLCSFVGRLSSLILGAPG